MLKVIMLSIRNKPFILRVVILNDVMLNVIYVECRYPECHHVECRGAKRIAQP
jgi:hypothetical protein